jgi:hypothetical protein
MLRPKKASELGELVAELEAQRWFGYALIQIAGFECHHLLDLWSFSVCSELQAVVRGADMECRVFGCYIAWRLRHQTKVPIQLKGEASTDAGARMLIWTRENGCREIGLRLVRKPLRNALQSKL